MSYDEGRSRIHADLSSALGLTLFRYGLDDDDVDLVRLLLRPGDTFVDGGANVGLFTLAAAARVGSSGKVIAFEPARTTRARLLANVKLNAFPWIEVRDEALADKEGTLELTVFGGDRAGLSSFSPAEKNGTIERVPVRALDALLGEVVPRLVKLDLEGAEHAALRGASELLARHTTSFFLELEDAHLRRQGSSRDAVVELLRAHGYELFSPSRSRFGGWMATAGVARRPGETPNVLAVPDRRFLADAKIEIVS